MGDWFKSGEIAKLIVRDHFIIMGMSLLVIGSICFTAYSIIKTIIDFIT